jgi:hypothetical protein
MKSIVIPSVAQRSRGTSKPVVAERRLEVLRHSQDANFLWTWRKTRAAGAAQEVPRGASSRAATGLSGPSTTALRAYARDDKVMNE